MFDTFVSSISFIRSSFDHCLYFKRNKEGAVIVYLLLYVDDMLFIGHDSNCIYDIRRFLSFKFEMKDLGHAKRILCMDIIRNRPKRLLVLKHTSYVEKVLSKFAMLESNLLIYLWPVISN